MDGAHALGAEYDLWCSSIGINGPASASQIRALAPYSLRPGHKN